MRRLFGKAKKLPKADDDQERLVQLLAQREIELVLDVGANEGRYASKLMTRRFAGRIVSVEPGEAAHRALSARARAETRWRVADRMALGDEPGTARLHTTNRSDMNSLLALAEETKAAFPKLVEAGAETVAVRRFDAVFERLSDGVGPERCFLKLDTQGSEAAILEGCGDRFPASAVCSSRCRSCPFM